MFSHRFYQTAGAAVGEQGRVPSHHRGHGERNRPGGPPAGGCAVPVAVVVPGAAVDRRQAAVELLVGAGPLQAERGHALVRPPAPGARTGGRRGAQSREERGRMAPPQEGTQTCHCQGLRGGRGV